MKTFVIWMLSGAMLGIIIASVITPPALSWYSAPGGLPKGAQIQAIVEIPEVIRYANNKLMQAQLIGAIVGAVLGTVIAVMTRGKRTISPAAAVEPSATPLPRP